MARKTKLFINNKVKKVAVVLISALLFIPIHISEAGNVFSELDRELTASNSIKPAESFGKQLTQAAQIEWTKEGNYQYYRNYKGNKQIVWTEIDGDWHCMRSSRVEQYSWQKIKGNWYYFDKHGRIITGFQEINRE